MSINIRLVLSDIDGCLTPGEAQPWDFAVMQFVAGLNHKARRDPNQFAVTLCTGRQEPYVEAMMQAIDAHAPGLYENGAGMYLPSEYRFAEHPSITARRRAVLVEAQRALTRDIVDKGIAQFQPGKIVSFTLYPVDKSMSYDRLADLVRLALDSQADEFYIDPSVSCVDIMLKGIDKGAGAEWLSQETGIPLAELAGIGDAASDLSFLSRVGFSAAPANAVDAVKRVVQYISPYENGRAVVDILSKWGAGETG